MLTHDQCNTLILLRMDYLNTTIKYLEEENQQLKERLKRMTDLNEIVNQQRSCQEKDYLVRFHQEEINVIREIGLENQQGLKKEIKLLLQEIQELHQELQTSRQSIILGKQTIQDISHRNQALQLQKDQIRNQLQNKQVEILNIYERCEQRQAEIKGQYHDRQAEIIKKYMQKLDKINDDHDDNQNKQQKHIIFLQNKIFRLEQQNSMLKNTNENLSTLMKQEQSKNSIKLSHLKHQITKLKQQNASNKLKINQFEISSIKYHQQIYELSVNNESLVRENGILKKSIEDIRSNKERELEKERFKNKNICKDLNKYNVYLMEELQREKKKEKSFHQSKKVLISKIKEIESKYENQKSISNISRINQRSKSKNISFDSSFHKFHDKTHDKTLKTAKKGLQTYQSISLDNSFNRQSPVVSSFIKDEKKIQLKHPLTINTRFNSQINILKIKDLDTPCFQEGKEKTIKRTIKIKK